MNREIKFRVWNKVHKHWAKPDRIGIRCEPNYNDKSPLILRCREGQPQYPFLPTWSDYEEYIVQQFTGQQDVDDNDLFEGDIVGLWNGFDLADESMGVYEVFWRRSGFYLKLHKNSWFNTSFGNIKANDNLPAGQPPRIIIDELPLENFNICKIIGNILENEELLQCT